MEEISEAVNQIKTVEQMNYFELLAWLGIGSSHPGGFPTTVKNLEVMEVKPEDIILDAGCGSGLTACHLAKQRGCRVIGIDLNPQMIEKARQRAIHEKVTDLVEFQIADAYQLPYPANHFDWVMCESITVFLDKEKAYREFFRVLKPEGRIADLEMSLLHELPDQLHSQLELCYGKGTNPLSYDDWCKVASEVGFADVEIRNPQTLLNTNSNLIFNELKKDFMLIKDLVQKVSNHPGLYTRLQQNANFMKHYKGYFGFGMVYGRKPTPPPQPKKPTLPGTLATSVQCVLGRTVLTVGSIREKILLPLSKHLRQ
ncbi:class I SAM-dependent methyltransferase [Desulfitobacterium sp. THU1]|uniref:class I SAM-dependent methyltransferase n=1 Tax=Desulfitobacterium sp. THU1 TaxID=3138072 RepID=UPI00311EEA5D